MKCSDASGGILMNGWTWLDYLEISKNLVLSTVLVVLGNSQTGSFA